MVDSNSFTIEGHMGLRSKLSAMVEFPGVEERESGDTKSSWMTTVHRDYFAIDFLSSLANYLWTRKLRSTSQKV